MRNSNNRTFSKLINLKTKSLFIIFSFAGLGIIHRPKKDIHMWLYTKCQENGNVNIADNEVSLIYFNTCKSNEPHAIMSAKQI